MSLYFFTSSGGFKGGLLLPLDAIAADAEAIAPTLPGWKKHTWGTTK